MSSAESIIVPFAEVMWMQRAHPKQWSYDTMANKKLRWEIRKIRGVSLCKGSHLTKLLKLRFHQPQGKGYWLTS